MSCPPLRRAAAFGAAVVVTAAVLGLAAPSAAGAPPPVPSCAVLTVPCELSSGLDAQSIHPMITPDGARVVFEHSALGGGEPEIFSTPILGGTPVRLSPQGAALLAISPDSTRALFTLSAGVTSQLWSVPVAGPASAAVRLAPNVRLSRPATISADGRKVVYVPASDDRLQVVPLAGPESAARRLTDPFVAGGRVGIVKLADGSASAVYTADQDTDRVTELYRVPLTLSPAPDPPTTKLNGPLFGGGSVGPFTIAPNDGPVVYLAPQDRVERELYRVRLGGGDRAKLNAPLPPAWRVNPPTATPDEEEEFLPARLSPDGSRVLYQIATSTGDTGKHTQLRSVPTGGPASAAVRLDLPPADAVNPFLLDYRIGADGRRVVYTLSERRLPWDPNDERLWLQTVSAVGPASSTRLLDGPFAETYPHYGLSPDGGRVVWQAPDTSPGELRGAPAGGGPYVRLSGTEDALPYPLEVGPKRVAYQVRVGGRLALYSARLDGTGTRYNLTYPLTGILSISHQMLTPDGGRVVYTVYRSRTELFSSRLEPQSSLPVP